MLPRIVDFRIPAEVDGQPVVVHIRTIVRTKAVHLLADTAEPAVGTVMAVGTVEVLYVDRVSMQVLQQSMER